MSNTKNKYYQPSLILKKLGKVNAEYAEVLAKAEKIRGEFISKESSTDVLISDFKINGESRLISDKLISNFSFKSDKALKNKPQVYLNGVYVQKTSIKSKTDGEFTFRLELADKENVIELKSQSGQVLDRREVTYTGSELRPDLYVLAVGVSSYTQNKYNLTFAAKDALDIAQFYGKLSQEEILDYQNKFFGEPLGLTDLNGTTIGQPMSFYDQEAFSTSQYFSVSEDGYYWLS